MATRFINQASPAEFPGDPVGDGKVAGLPGKAPSPYAGTIRIRFKGFPTTSLAIDISGRIGHP